MTHSSQASSTCPKHLDKDMAQAATALSHVWVSVLGPIPGVCWLMTSLIQGLEQTSPTEKQPVHAGAGLVRAGAWSWESCRASL